MKAFIPTAAWLAFAALPLAYAQSAAAQACPDCKDRDQLIASLRSEIANLKRVDGAEAQTPAAIAVPESATPAASGRTYTVVAGDGLIKIARKTGCKAEDLAALNGLKLDSVIRTGQTLQLPTAATAPETPAAAAATSPKTYKIKEGDTYYSLSRRLKIPLDELTAANPQAKATELYEGRVINLPVAAAAASPAGGTDGTGNGPSPEAAPPAPPADAANEALNEAANEAAGPQAEKTIRAIKVDEEISYGDFATRHGTNIERLNSLNDLNLTSATILAKGSELYVPAQP